MLSLIFSVARFDVELIAVAEFSLSGIHKGLLVEKYLDEFIPITALFSIGLEINVLK